VLLNEMEHGRESAEAWFEVARLQFAASERLSALAFNAYKAAFEDLVAHTRDMLEIRRPADVFQANLDFARPSLEKALAHWRSIFDVALQSQNEMMRMLQARAADRRDGMAKLLAAAGPGAVAAYAIRAALDAARRNGEALRILSDMAGGLAEAGFTAAIRGIKGRTT
jgi:phasin family protein